MYLKNTSTTACIVINTTRGKVGIRPQEVVDIRYKVLPPVSRSLIQVQEEDYLTFCEGRKGTIETLIENETDTLQQVRSMDEEKLEDLERIDDEIVEEIKDPSIMGFVNSLLEHKHEEIEGNEALVVNETDSENETVRIEQQIDDLKKAWATTKAPRKKEKLAKEIKELQKQLKKIQ